MHKIITMYHYISSETSIGGYGYYNKHKRTVGTSKICPSHGKVALLQAKFYPTDC